MLNSKDFQQQVKDLTAAGQINALQELFEARIAHFETALTQHDDAAIRPLASLYDWFSEILLNHNDVEAALIVAERGQVFFLQHLHRLPKKIIQKINILWNDIGLCLHKQSYIIKAQSAFTARIVLLERLQQILKPKQWTIELHNDLANSYLNRGIIFRIEGQLDKSVVDCSHAIELLDDLRKLLEPHGEWHSELCNDLVHAYSMRGVAFCIQGQNDKAMADYTQAITLGNTLQKLLEPQEQWLPDLRSKLAEAYMNRGNVFWYQDQLDKAITDYAHAIKIYDNLRILLELSEQWSPEIRSALASVYLNRGVAFYTQDQLDKAVADYTQAIMFQNELRVFLESRGVWTPKMRSDLAKSHIDRGIALLDQGQLDNAMADCIQTITLLNELRILLEPLGEWTPELRNNLALAYSTYGNIFRQQGKNDKALENYNQAIVLQNELQTLLEPQGQWTPKLRNDLATIYVNRGHIQSQFDDAVADYTQAITIRNRLRMLLKSQKQWTPKLRNDLANTYTSRGVAFFHQNQPNKAKADYTQAITINKDIPLGILPKADVSQFRLYAHAALLLHKYPDPHNFARNKSRRMADLLELILPGENDWSYKHKLHDLFAQFHAHWLSYCVTRNEIKIIPEILAIIQGRNIAAEIVDRLNQDQADTPKAVRIFQKLRMKLRELSTRIQNINQSSDASTAIDDGISSHNRKQKITTGSTPLNDSYEKLSQRYEDLLQRTRIQRERAAKKRGYEYLNPARIVTTIGLQAVLAEDEALLLAIDRKEQASGLILIRRDHPARWIAVPELGKIAHSVRRFSNHLGQQRGYRRGPEPTTDSDIAMEQITDPLNFWPNLADWQAKHIWSPLEEDLADVRRLICITHGDLHLLPLDAGAPQHLTLGRFPGLVFFAEQRGIFGKRPVPITQFQKSLALDAYAGDHNPLLYADDEVKLIKSLYQPDTVVHPGQFPNIQQPTYLGHLACHAGEDQQREGTATLNLYSKKNIGQDSILGAKLPLQNVYINACMAAWTVEDLSGTPSGLICALFRKGAFQVVGALVSIPDNWACVLALLTHHFLLQNLKLDQALREGKRCLESGKWPKLVRKKLYKFIQNDLNTKQADINNGLRVRWEILKMQQCSNEDAIKELQQNAGAWLTELNIDASAQANLIVQEDTVVEDWIQAVTKAATAALTNRIPSQPDLGTLKYGMVTFGEITPLNLVNSTTQLP